MFVNLSTSFQAMEKRGYNLLVKAVKNYFNTYNIQEVRSIKDFIEAMRADSDNSASNCMSSCVLFEDNEALILRQINFHNVREDHVGSVSYFTLCIINRPQYYIFGKYCYDSKVLECGEILLLNPEFGHLLYTLPVFGYKEQDLNSLMTIEFPDYVDSVVKNRYVLLNAKVDTTSIENEEYILLAGPNFKINEADLLGLVKSPKLKDFDIANFIFIDNIFEEYIDGLIGDLIVIYRDDMDYCVIKKVKREGFISFK